MTKRKPKKARGKGAGRRSSSPPSIVQSPSTGDLGFPGHPWLRIDDAALGLHHPTVMFDADELSGNGYDPRTLGMTRIGDHQTRFEIPVVAVMADMKSRYDVDLYEDDVQDMSNPRLIIGGVFEDAHPDEWWSRVHAAGRLLIVAGDTRTVAAAIESNTPIDFGRIWADSHIARVRGLMVRAYDTGVGTAMPEA